MDIQSQVAARRAQLEKEAVEARDAAAEDAKTQQAAERVHREAALDDIAADISGRGLPVSRRGDDLELTERPPPVLDIAGLRKSKVQSLVGREARKLWSPAENWQVIALIVSGLFLITFYGLGVLLIIGGMLRGSALNKRHQETVRQRYPELFSVPI